MTPPAGDDDGDRYRLTAGDVLACIGILLGYVMAIWL